MAAPSPSSLRRTILNSRLLNSISSTSAQTRRYARVLTSPFAPPSSSNSHSRLRFLQTNSTDSAAARVIEKYKDKLEQKMKAEGIKTYTDLRQRYKDKLEAVKNDPTLPPLPDALLEAETIPDPRIQSQYQPIIPPPRIPTTSPPPGVKTLSTYLDLSKLAPLTSDEISQIWRARHSSDPTSLCATIPTKTFSRLIRNAKLYPMFILPLPRPGGGIEMHFLQWTIPHTDVVTVLFTSLAAYKLHGEFAVPHTALTHHLELMEEKAVVLAQGGVVKDSGVSVEEGRWLIMALQKFYGADKEDGEDGKRRVALLEKFSRGGAEFKVEDVIEEVQRLG